MGRKQRNLTQLNIQRSQAWNRFEDLCNQWQPTYNPDDPDDPDDPDAVYLYYRIITALIDLNETRNQRRAPTDSFRNRLNRVLCENNLLHIVASAFDRFERPNTPYFMMSAYSYPNVGDSVNLPACDSDGTMILVTHTVAYTGLLTFTVEDSDTFVVCNADM